MNLGSSCLSLPRDWDGSPVAASLGCIWSVKEEGWLSSGAAWDKSKIGSDLGEGGSRVKEGIDVAALSLTPEVPASYLPTPPQMPLRDTSTLAP